MGVALALVYLSTMAPGVTFWDAGEFIAAANGFGIPHPPGTPLYVSLGRGWIVAIGWLAGSARAMNLLSVACSAAAGALGAWIVATEMRDGAGFACGAIAGGLCAGLMCSVWTNATETEVYAVSLLHVALILYCAHHAADEADGEIRWLACTAYALLLAPAVHLSALVGAPAAIAFAAHRRHGSVALDRVALDRVALDRVALDRVALDRVALDRVTLLGGATVAAAGVGRVSPVLVALGAAAMLVGGVLLPAGHRNRWSRAAVALLLPLAASALLILMYRARHDPPLNQGNPATWRALVDLVARRQYDVQGMLPREAPLWLQAANVAQYADWQVALGWGRGIFTTPARVITTVAYLALAAVGWKSMRRESPRLALMLAVLLASGSAGVAVYLNLKAGASLGWGVIPASAPHEARERDYFFVLGFWAWGLLAGWGALAIARRRGWRRELSVAVAIVPLVANWGAVTRSREPQRTAARRFAVAVLGSVPRGALLFASGDNDTYPLWYVQQVEGVRRDVYLVTVPLLPAEWYQAEVARRTGLRWPAAEHVDGARWQHEEAAALIARAARDGGRVVAASPGLSLRERTLLGSAWTLDGAVYISHGKATGRVERAGIDTAAARRWVAARPPLAPRSREVSDVTESMLTLLECPRLGLPWGGSGAARDSLEVSCNLR